MSRKLLVGPLGLGVACLALAGCDGPRGDSCLVTDNGDGTKTVTCGDSTVVLHDGADGDDGTSTTCTVQDNGDGSKTIDCGTAGSITINDGQDGTDGAAGPQGPAGPEGPTQLGQVTLTVKFDRVAGVAIATALPAEGVFCFTNPDFTGNSADVVAEGVTNASGKVVFALPAGDYGFKCRPGAPGVAPVDYADDMALVEVSLPVGGLVGVTINANRTNPLYFVTAPAAASVLPGATVAVQAPTLSDDTATVTYALASGLTDVTVDAATGAFTVPGLDALLGGLDAGRGLWKAFALPRVPGWVALGDGVTRSLAKAYAIRATATDGTNTVTTKLTVGVKGVQDTQGIATAPIGVMAVADGGATGPYAWTLTAPGGSAAVLVGADTRNPWLVPDVAGAYTLANGTTTLTLTAGTYVGVDACDVCHGGALRGPSKEEWSTVGLHGNHNYFSGGPAQTIVEWGLQGVDYSKTCFQCHTAGGWFSKYSNGRPAPTVDNGGFLTTMVKLDNGGTYDPAWDTTLTQNDAWVGDGLDHWTGLDPSLKALAGIQCESCHGPGSQHRTSFSSDDISVAWDVGVCAVCHDAPSHHDKVELWAQSPHNNALAVRGETSASCARCHTAQGFAQMAANIRASGDASAASITRPAAGTGASQTCQACHDAHTTELRLHGDIAMTPNGYGFSGVGAAAVCLGCHVAMAKAPATGPVGTPHHGPQGDVVFGVNAYFVSGSNVSDHAAVADVCVGCHVTLIPEGVETHNDNHTFRPNESICVDCHSYLVDGEATKGAVRAGLAALEARMEAGVKSALEAAVGADGSFTVKTASDVAPQIVNLTTAPDTVEMDLAGFHGQPSWLLHYGSTVYEATLGNMYAGNVAAPTSTTPLAWDNTGNLAKALWNFLLIAEDKSEGIHNPTFALDVIDATLEQTF